MKRTLGIVFSVYDAFEDVAIGIDLIRDNWAQGNDSPVVVSCGYERLDGQLAHLRIDQAIQYATPPVPRLQGKCSSQLTLGLRTFEGIRQGCLKAITTSADYVIHVHADAWMFSYEAIQHVVELMERQGAVFAARIAERPMAKLPFFDDHFFIFNTAFARKTGLWDIPYDAALFNPVFDSGGIHAILLLLVESRVPFDNFLRYSNMADNVGLFNEKVGSILNPWNFESRYGFLHSNVRYGTEVWYLRQAYLRRFSQGKGTNILAYLERPFRAPFPLRQGVEYPAYYNPANLTKFYRYLQIELLGPTGRKLRHLLSGLADRRDGSFDNHSAARSR